MDFTEEKDHNETGRRDFIKTGLAVGLGVAAVGAGLGAFGQTGTSSEAKGELVTLLTADGELVTVDANKLTPVQKDDLLDEYQERGRVGIPGKKWVMVIDLAKCRNARMCVTACQTAHHLKPEQYHINTLRMQDSEHGEPYFMPKPCFHCDNPPCTKVCPVDATFKRSDGIVLIDNERCIGCRFCIAACPYSARSFHWLDPKKVEGDESRVYDVELNVPQKRGTITKCVFSADRLRKGLLPYCVSSCPNGVYWFGDVNEDAVTNGTTKETTRFSDLIRDNAGYTVMEELGTKPSVFYLPAKDRLFPYTEGSTELETTK